MTEEEVAAGLPEEESLNLQTWTPEVSQADCIIRMMLRKAPGRLMPRSIDRKYF